jgi:hypothetical protein
VAVAAFAEAETFVSGSIFCNLYCRYDRLALLPTATAKLVDNDQVKMSF